jgi:hypothetical protein
MNNSRPSNDALGKTGVMSDPHLMDVCFCHSSKLDRSWLGISELDVYPDGSRRILSRLSSGSKRDPWKDQTPLLPEKEVNWVCVL